MHILPRALSFCLATLIACQVLLPFSARALPANPIVFVTQPPWPADFTTVNSTFGNHLASMAAIPRGGDLYIRYVDGSLKNLTQAAGFGQSGMQGASAIAVRDPSVHWSGEKVIFSMVIGAPTAQYQTPTFRWQIYEVTNLGSSATPVITKVNNQPENYNNVSPIYGTDDRIIFTSDRPRGGESHLYPQRDEYESSPTNTGLWSLNPSTGDLKHLDHSPSGDFSPILDSFGRIIFTRWDHLQRDQQNRCANSGFGAFNYSSESASAEVLDTDLEVFPEPRGMCEDDTTDSLNLHTLNHFLPWQINEDGTDMETLNHVGRHELVGYLGGSFNDDPNVIEFYGQYSRLNQNSIENLFQIREDPANPGVYFGTNAPEFGTHAAGQIVKIDGHPDTPADEMLVTYITHEDTSGTDDTPSADHIGLSRDPEPLSDGTLVASHTTATRADANIGSSTAPASRYAFRLKSFSQSGGLFVPSTALTSGIQKTISFWSPDQLVTFTNVTMWELQGREVVARSRPAQREAELPEVERNVFEDLNVSIEELKEFLRENSLALVISRNVTTRDKLDRQQPSNLRVVDSETSSIPRSGKVYDVSDLQFFQGDHIRGYAGSAVGGRRIIAQPMHDVSDNPENPTGPAGSVKIASDGSMAAFVPAGRALTYQLTDAEGKGVVRERFWLTFQAGEIRVCASCHGVNSQDHLGHVAPTNEPEALRLLLEHWQSIPHDSPTFQLTLPNRLRSGRQVRLSVSGNDRAASRAASLRLRVRGRDCGALRTFTLNVQSAYTRRFRVPNMPDRVALRFRVVYAGSVKDSKTATLNANTGLGQVTSNVRVCQAFRRALR